MKKGFYIGRFQPFHLGHLSAIRQALKEVGELYIGIGSSQYKGQQTNPFSGEERKEMVQRAVREADLEDRCTVYLVPDIHEDDKWCAHVREIVPEFDLVYVGNEGLVKELFEKEGKSPIRMVEHELDISATKIREAVRKNQAWEDFLPPAVTEYLKENGGADKIRDI